MTEEEAKNAFNQNMMSGGGLTDGPRQFGLKNDKKWLVSSYEAGDVVLHNAYTVSSNSSHAESYGRITLIVDPCLYHQLRSWWGYTARDGPPVC